MLFIISKFQVFLSGLLCTGLQNNTHPSVNKLLQLPQLQTEQEPVTTEMQYYLLIPT